MGNVINVSFTSWIEVELASRNWNYAELSRRSGVSQGAISHVINGKRNAGVEFCEAIAKAFGIPPEEVFRRAGILPKLTGRNFVLDRVNYMVALLPEKEQKQVMEYLEFLISRQEKKDSDDKSKKMEET